MLDWLVIGGGPHGVHAAVRLIGEVGVSRDSLRILDDEAALFGRWRRATRNTGMRYLRSPGVHHIDLRSNSIQRFADRCARNVSRPFTRPYSRPALELFDLHCDDLVERHRLQEIHVRGRACGLTAIEGGLRVEFDSVAEDSLTESPTEGSAGGAIEARQVILALGAPREPQWPEWAQRAREACDEATRERLRHVFDPGFELEDHEGDEEIAVVGGGITGGQVALRLARQGRRVTLLSRHAPRVHQFDSDPGWQGPMHMGGFSRLTDPNERRERIRQARHRGSMPQDVLKALRRAAADGTIDFVEDAEVASATPEGARIGLDLGERRVDADRVLLATGFPACRPGGAWLDEAVDALGLSCADCGFPVVDRGLRWHPRLLVTGALAELELGPVSRNISGAQRAGDRIVAVARSLASN